MIRRSTIVYLVLLLALVVAYIYLKNRDKTANTAASETPQPTVEVKYLFAALDGTPSSIRVESKSGEVVELLRGADQTWTLTQPIQTKADPASAEAAASQVATIPIVDNDPGVAAKDVGLEVPEYVLTVKFSSGAERAVDVGMVTPSETGYYVRDAAGKIVIASKSGIDALVGLLQNPPYLETLTPSPSAAPATETATPLPASATPEAVTPPSGGATAQP